MEKTGFFNNARQGSKTFKTVEGQTLEGVGNIDITKADVDLPNVDNTSDANKPVSTAQQTALDSKEDVGNKTSAFQATPDDDKYPTEKLVKDNLDLKTNTSDIINNLTSTDTDKPLSAAMGKSLEDNKLPKTSNRIIPNASITQSNNYKTATINPEGNAVEASPNIPPLTTTQRNSINTKFIGLTIFNTTTGKIETWNGSAWIGVSADQIGDGSVSNTEFQYINSLTDNAQDQIDLKKLNAQQNTLTVVTVNTTTPTTIASTTITPRSTSNKILLIATGDGNPNQTGGWHILRLYRDSTPLDPYIINENAGGSSKNCPFALSNIDSPSSTSPIVYTLKAYQGASSFTYGEGGTVQAPRLIAIDFQP